MVCKVYCPTSIEQDIGVVPEEGYNPYFFPVEGAYLPFFFTDETFVKVLSALVNGAAITYGDEGRAVVWEFLRNVEFPVSICDLIAECIANNALTQQALRDFITTDEAISDYFSEKVQGLTSAQIGSFVVDNGCDNSNVAGAVIAIVERMNLINEDALEIIEVGTNDEEKVAAVLEGIPIMGELPIGDIIDFFQDLLEDFGEGYSAAVTEEWKDNVAEELYCLALQSENCELTYEQLFVYFQNRAGSTLTIGSLLIDIINFVRTGDFSTDELVASGMYAIQLALVLRGSEFFGMNLPKMSSLTRDALPSTRWEEWEDCAPPPPEGCFDLTVDDNDWYPSDATGEPAPNVWGLWVNGEGLKPSTFGPFHQFFFTREPEDGVTIIGAYFRFNEPATQFRLGREGSTNVTYTGDPVDEITFDPEDYPGFFPLSLDGNIYITFDDNTAPTSTFRVVEWCYIVEE